MMTKTEAEKVGQELLDKMKDKNWKLRVWQNLGWHCEISNGPISISYHPENQNPYLILMSDDPRRSGTGAGIWTMGKSSFKDPLICIKKQVEVARKRVDLIYSTVLVAENILQEELNCLNTDT